MFPALGAVEKVTVSDVEVAEVTVPTAPLLKVTTFSAAVVLKFVPAIVIVAALAAKLALLEVTVGAVPFETTLATLTAVPLERELVVTDALRTPTAVGFVVIVIVSSVAVAAATVPTGPPAKVTVLLVRTGSNPKPLMTKVVPLRAKFVSEAVTTGLTEATCTDEAEATPLVVTMAVNEPAQGFFEKLTVNDVAVAAVTVPRAPLLNVTVLSAGVVLKPLPVIVTVEAVAKISVVVCVTVGRTVAI